MDIFGAIPAESDPDSQCGQYQAHGQVLCFQTFVGDNIRAFRIAEGSNIF